MKIRIFLSSSSEHSSIAKALEANLAGEGFEPTLWSREAHGASQYNLEALLREAKGSDFGIFVFAPDDQLTLRGEVFNIVRDNVLFELGVFIGILGRSRCFIVQSTEQPLRLPSDLEGVTTLEVDPQRSDGNLRRSFGPIVTTITELVLNTAKAQVSDFTTNDLKLLKSCKDTSMPSTQEVYRL